MIKIIIFDLWNTVAKKNISVSQTLAKKFKIEERGPEYLHRYELSVQLKKWKEAENMAKSYLKMFDLPATEENINFTIDTFINAARGAKSIDGMPALLTSLRSKFKILLMTNTSNLGFSEVNKNLQLDKLFDKIYCSFDYGMKKPDPAFFEQILKDFNASPGELLLVDDYEMNINAAKAFGMNAIQFKDVENLKEELTKLGIKI